MSSNPCKKWITEANDRWRERGIVYCTHHWVLLTARLEYACCQLKTIEAGDERLLLELCVVRPTSLGITLLLLVLPYACYQEMAQNTTTEVVCILQHIYLIAKTMNWHIITHTLSHRKTVLLNITQRLEKCCQLPKHLWCRKAELCCQWTNGLKWQRHYHCLQVSNVPCLKYGQNTSKLLLFWNLH